MKEYRPGSGAMASQLDAEMVSVMLLPVGNVALAAPAQQSRRMRTSEADRSSKVWMADHCNQGESGFRVLLGIGQLLVRLMLYRRETGRTRTTCSAETHQSSHGRHSIPGRACLAIRGP